MDELPNRSGLLVVIALGLLLAVGIAGGGYLYVRRQQATQQQIAAELLVQSEALERIRAQQLAEENARND